MMCEENRSSPFLERCPELAEGVLERTGGGPFDGAQDML